jgi:FKBP-type peptidyl-prolyl cis-trans isomerase 2
MAIKEGDKVKIHYTGKFDDGTVFDSSEGKGALEVNVGHKQVIPGFEKALIGMEKGESKDIKLEPKDAYGDHNPAMVQKVPKDQLPAEIKEGSMLVMKAPTGQQFPVLVKEIGEKEVTLDLNHPLAGKTLNFNLKVEDIQEGAAGPAPSGCSCCGPDDDCKDKCAPEECGPVQGDNPADDKKKE